MITTVNGFVFLCRENYGKLYMTPMISGDTANPSPTIRQLLYWLSSLAANLPPLPEKDRNGNKVPIRLATYKHPAAAPQAPGPPPVSKALQTGGNSFYSGSRGASQVRHYILRPTDESRDMILEPGDRSNQLGRKTFLVQLLPS